MTPHYPRSRAARSARREAIKAEYIRFGLANVSSLNCGAGKHAGQPGGCANDGRGCLCECHDWEDEKE